MLSRSHVPTYGGTHVAGHYETTASFMAIHNESTSCDWAYIHTVHTSTSIHGHVMDSSLKEIRRKQVGN